MPIQRKTLLVSQVLLVLLACNFPQVTAQDDKATEKQPIVELNLTDVVAYSAGVGFVSFTGQVTDDGIFRISTSESDLDDVLKSLVVLSDSGTATVHLPNDVARTQRVDQRIVQAQTIGEILQSLRGEMIEVTLNVDKKLSGRLLAVELRSTVEGSEIVDREIVSLLSKDGVISVPLNSIVNWMPERADVRERLQRELLEIASKRFDTDQETSDLVEIEFQFRGKGQREVMVGWLRTMPIWKPSYRFVDDQLQLWTTVENTTRSDWDNVSLTLVDGHPIAFRSPLYHTRFSHRSIVPLPLPDHRLAPELEEAFEADAGQPLAIAGRDAQERRMLGGFAGGGMGGGFGGFGGGGMGGGMMGGDGGFGGGGMGGGFGGAPAGDSLVEADPSTSLEDHPFGGTVEPAAGTSGADLHITTREVSIARGISRSAPSPELKIDAEVISVFVESHDPHTPLRSLEVTNAMPMRLPAGPLTVYSGGTYLGDAMLPELSPGVPRLVGFGNDANIRVDVTREPEKVLPLETLTAIPKQRVFVTKTPTRKVTHYRIDSRIDQDRTLLIDHPVVVDWSVIKGDIEPEETAASRRYRITLKPGEERTLAVVEMKHEKQTHKWIDVSLATLISWSRNEDLKKETVDEVKRVLDLRRSRTEIQARMTNARMRLDRARSETTRIATLIRDVKPTDGDDLRTRYVKKLSQLEDEIESLEKQAIDDDLKLRPIERELQ